MIRRHLTHILAAAALAGLTSLAQAAWPDKPINIIVPYPPGGNVDVAARLIAPGLQAALGQPIVIENKAGAGGMIAGEFVAHANPDGYTLFMAANGPLLFSPLIFNREDAYRWNRNFEPISSVSFTAMVLEAKPSLPVKTVHDLIALARKEPGKLTMASPGAGTSNHLHSELLQHITGARWITAQYKGNAPANNDMLSGQVDFQFDQVSVAAPFIKAGKLRALAVTSAKRVSQLPDVPTFAEAGIQGMEASTFTGLLAPKGTPVQVVNTISKALDSVLRQPDIIDRFNALGAEARGSTPEEFTRYLTDEDNRWTPIIKSAHITAN